jgi:transposase
VKRSVLCDAAGVPLAVAIDGANRHDIKLLEPTLQALAIECPPPGKGQSYGMCLDKGYDASSVRGLLEDLGLEPHIRSRGEEARDLKRHPQAKARRWVVERDHSWLNRFRAILVRWCKKPKNYLACLHLACGLIVYQQAGLVG